MAKVKMKSNRSAKKRFKITGTGKIKRWKSGGAIEKARPCPPKLGRQGKGNAEGVLNFSRTVPSKAP
jgi:hypothetical protein